MYTRNCEIKPGMEFPDGMQRICAAVEYRGSDFHGFQIQKFAVETVQGALESAISNVADEAIGLVCAGRTDAGVHASGQVIHFDTLAARPMKAWSLGVNAHLPSDISIKWAQPISNNFHARFSASDRTYRYLIYNQNTRPAVLSQLVTWFKRPLNMSAMNLAAQTLIGEHDFSSFRAAQCQARSPVRTIRHIKFAAFGDMIVLEIKANAFLHHMVRNIVGTLFAIGTGDKPISWAKEVLLAKNRNVAAATASGYGLYLVKVDYPREFDLPAQVLGPAFIPEDLPWQSAEF